MCGQFVCCLPACFVIKYHHDQVSTRDYIVSKIIIRIINRCGLIINVLRNTVVSWTLCFCFNSWPCFLLIISLIRFNSLSYNCLCLLIQNRIYLYISASSSWKIWEMLISRYHIFHIKLTHALVYENIKYFLYHYSLIL